MRCRRVGRGVCVGGGVLCVCVCVVCFLFTYHTPTPSLSFFLWAFCFVLRQTMANNPGIILPLPPEC